MSHVKSKICQKFFTFGVKSRGCRLILNLSMILLILGGCEQVESHMN